MRQYINSLIESNPNSDVAIKYHSKNKIVKKLMKDYEENFYSVLQDVVNINNLIEIGAGEGFWSKILAEKYPKAKIVSSDISDDEYVTRKKNLQKYHNISVIKADATKLEFEDNSFDLVVCLEVLEHIPKYEEALKEIFRVNSNYALLSVPNEPIWSLLNLLRGKYLSRMGNTPDHVNRWSKKSFLEIVKKNGYKIIKSKMPLPWTMVLVEKN